MVEIVASWDPTGATARRTGNGRWTSGKVSPRSLCRVATPACWGRMTANRRRLLMATTPPGSAPSSVASIPIGSSRRRSRCQKAGPVLLRLKRIPRELQSCRSLPAQHWRGRYQIAKPCCCSKTSRWSWPRPLFYRGRRGNRLSGSGPYRRNLASSQSWVDRASLAPKRRAFVEVNSMLTHNQIRTAGGRFICTLGVLSILEQHLRGKTRDAVSTNASGNVAACDACGKYFGLRHSEICHEARSGKSIVRRSLFFCLKIPFEPGTL